MSQTHLHLVITHLPIFGSILGALFLFYGLLTKSLQTKAAGYYVLLVSAIGAGIAYLTGEGAEETAENIAGISENMIEEHEEFAIFALWSFIALGIAALVGLFLTFRKKNLARPTAIAILLLSLLSFGLVARTGWMGGQIRHTEISGNVNTGVEQESED